MMPLFPASSYVKLAEQSMDDRRRMDQRTHADGTKDFMVYDELTPDPMLMTLRQIMHSGPIGALVRRIDRWIEARDERRYGQSIDHASPYGGLECVSRTPPDLDCAVDRDERIAA